MSVRWWAWRDRARITFGLCVEVSLAIVDFRAAMWLALSVSDGWWLLASLVAVDAWYSRTYLGGRGGGICFRFDWSFVADGAIPGDEEGVSCAGKA